MSVLQFAALFIFTFSLNGPAADLITSWPGLTALPSFQMYSGYLDASSEKHLHYLFVECATDSDDKPIVVWLNGGPGCSSLDGLLYEHGPFLIQEDGQSFVKNPHSWNTVSNMLYIESPIGVGFSYSDTGNYTIGDYQTARDGAAALVDFFSKFSLPATHPLYITGESYGGVYVPMLTLQVAKEGKLNIKSFAVGNGLSSYNINDNSLMFFAHYHGLLSKTQWGAVTSACCVGAVTQENCDFGHNETNVDCVAQTSAAMSIVYESGLNFYDLYGDCTNTQKYERSIDNLFWFLDLEAVKKKHLEANVPCIDSNGANIWLNQDSVRQALHVTPSKLDRWEICSDKLDYQREVQSVLPFYLSLFTDYAIPGFSYNGDTDMACNFLGNEWFAYSLQQHIKVEWQPWKLPNDAQISGFMQQFGYLTYYTVKGAGHMVPQWRPKQGLYIIEQMIKN